jgi:DNA-directed RNA polymerase subunit M/transcription elongation factor TFIIS
MMPKKMEGSSLLQLVCPKCNKKVEKFASLPSETVRIIRHSPKQCIAVIDKEGDLRTLPTISVECPRCGNNRAYVWLVQTRGTDESSTQFMRCVKCGFTIRETS